MDVELELAKVRKRVKQDADAKVLRACAKLHDMTVEEYLAKQRADALEAVRTGMVTQAELIGQHYRRINDQFVEFWNNFAKGWAKATR